MSDQAEQLPGEAIKTVRLVDVIRPLLRGAPLAIIVAIIAVAISLAISRSTAPVYEASVALLSSVTPGSFGGHELATPPQVNPSAYQRALMEGPVIRNAMMAVNAAAPSEEELLAFKNNLQITVEHQLISGMVMLDVRNNDPQLAADYANVLASELVRWDRDRVRRMIRSSAAELQLNLTEIEDRLTTMGDGPERAALEARRDQYVQQLATINNGSAAAVAVGLLETLAPATVPVRPVSPRPVFNAFVAMLIGLFLGYGIQFLRWSLLDQVNDRSKLGEATGATVLGHFGVTPRKPRSDDLSSDAAFLRLRLLQLPSGANSQPLVIGITDATDSPAGNGLARKLTSNFTASGYRTILLDANPAHDSADLGNDDGQASPYSLEKLLEAPERGTKSLLTRISKGASPRNPVIVSSQTVGNHELIERGFARLRGQLREDFDVVIIGLPSILRYPDALAAATSSTISVLCVETRVPSAKVREAADRLKGPLGNRIAVVLAGSSLSARRRTKQDS